LSSFVYYNFYATSIDGKRFHLLRSILPLPGLSVGLSVCLSVTFVHCAQTAKDIDTISFVATAPCLSKIVLKFSLYRSTPSSTNFAQKWPTRCRFERRRRSMSN